jgi:signal transduction histidine kinase
MLRGIGLPIPPQALPHLFDPFRHGRESEIRSPDWPRARVVHRATIVAAHGGSISVSSSAEAGTTFTLRLPRRAPA